MKTSLALIAACAALPALAEPRVQAASPIEPYYRFVHAMSVDRSDVALAAFADDAVVVSDPACPVERPCSGRRAIAERYLPALRRHDVALPVFVRFFDGRHVVTRGDSVRGERVHHRIELRDGRIQRLVATRASWLGPYAAASPDRVE